MAERQRPYIRLAEEIGSDYENSESSSPTLTPPPPEEPEVVDEWFIGNEVQPIRDEPPRAAYTHADAIDKGHEVVPIPPRRVALSDDVTLPQRMVEREVPHPMQVQEDQEQSDPLQAQAPQQPIRVQVGRMGEQVQQQIRAQIGRMGEQAQAQPQHIRGQIGRMMEQAWNAPNEPASQQRQQNLSRPESQGARRRPIHEASQGVQPPITQRSQLNLPLSQPESRGAVKRSIHEASSQHGQHGILPPISQQRQQLNLPLSSQTESRDTTNRSIHEALAQQAKRGFLPPISQQEQILSPTKKKKESTTIFKKITDKFCAVKVEPDPVKRSDQLSSRMPVQPQPSGSQQHVQSLPLPTQKVQQDPSATHSGLILSARQLLEDQQATEQRLSLSPPRVLQDQPMITSQPSSSLSPQRAQDQPIVATVQGCSLSLSPERVQEAEASTSQPSRRPALFRKKKKEKKSKELAPAQ